MNRIDTRRWKQELPAFKEKTRAFFSGEISKADYKSFSGYYGSYAQRGGQKSMLRLRLPAGRITQKDMAFIAGTLRRYQIGRLHFTTCQTIQLHDLDARQAGEIIEDALDAGIVPIGGGGDYPRNVMCSPLSGVEQGEYFDVMPFALAAGEYLLHLIGKPKMPRKLKVGFSNSPQNLTHATYRDLGFAARPDGNFDVYSAGGLGSHPLFGVLVAEGIKPAEILYHIKAMWLTFCAYGNYENRGKARTRYLQEALGGQEGYRRAYLEKLQEALEGEEKLQLTLPPPSAGKAGEGELQHPRIIPQKQPGLYAAVWHPLGGQPAPEDFCALCDALQGMPAVEIRLAPDETAYIINLNANEAQRVLTLTGDSARSPFETSVSCIGAATCQIGLRDSQALLKSCVEAVRAAGLPPDALPQMHISGCPSSCGTHQTGLIGLRGAVKQVQGKPQPAYMLYVGGNERQGQERMGHGLGTLLEKDVPAFLVELGKAAAASGKSFCEWMKEDPEAVERIAAPYLD